MSEHSLTKAEASKFLTKNDLNNSMNVGRRHNLRFCLRCAVAFIAFLYVITGCLVLACAVYGKTKIVGGDELHLAVWVTMLLGGLLSSIGLVTFCGAFMESMCISGLSAVLLSVLCISFGALTGYMQVELDMAGHDVEGVLWANLKYYDPTNSSTTQELDSYQRVLSCCGVEGPEDWLKSSIEMIPSSCPRSEGRIPGCKEVIFSMVKGTAGTAVSLLGGLTGFILLGFIFTVCFSCFMCHRDRCDSAL